MYVRAAKKLFFVFSLSLHFRQSFFVNPIAFTDSIWCVSASYLPSFAAGKYEISIRRIFHFTDIGKNNVQVFVWKLNGGAIHRHLFELRNFDEQGRTWGETGSDSGREFTPYEGVACTSPFHKRKNAFLTRIIIFDNYIQNCTHIQNWSKI